MHYVYVLRSEKRNYLYVGITNDVQRRFKEHNEGHNKTTKPYLPFELLFSEKCSDRASARLREKYLKSGCGKEWIKKKYMKN